MLLTCHCLNIKVHAKQQNIAYAQVHPEGNIGDDLFFKQEFGLVELDENGITQELGVLIHERYAGKWKVNKCINCGVDVYATKESPAMLMVNKNLQNDPLLIERLKNSPDFSVPFNVILRSDDSQYSFTLPDASSRNYESLQFKLNAVQQHLADFLLREEDLMEARIRQYEEEEHTKFKILKENVKTEKKKMINLILSNEENNREKSKGQSQQQKRLLSQGSGDESTGFPKSGDMNIPKRKSHLTRYKSTPAPGESRRDHGHDLDADTMFMLDDHDDHGKKHGYGSSDDDTDDEIYITGRGDMSNAATTKSSIYSSSVPIAVPKWNAVADPEDEDHEFPEDLEQIPARMQALAQSITNDERYIFGDRPRPRVNTLSAMEYKK